MKIANTVTCSARYVISSSTDCLNVSQSATSTRSGTTIAILFHISICIYSNKLKN